MDGVLKVTVKATERTRALVEGVDSTRVRKKTFTILNNYVTCVYILRYFKEQPKGNKGNNKVI